MNFYFLRLVLLALLLPYSTLAKGEEKLPLRLKNFLTERNLTKDAHFQQNPERTLKTWLLKYDEAAIPEVRYLHKYPHCIQAAVIGERAVEPECRLLENIQTSVSDLPEFRTLFEPNISAERRQELFADYGAQYILKSTFHCDHPTLFRFFNWYFDGFKQSDVACAESPSIFLTSIDDRGFTVDFESLDFSRLYQIHYLFASEGAASFSRFGHSMLRLVFCSPLRKTMGPDCLKDLLYHRVVSFRASVIDFEINALDGINGKYPSILFMSPFLSVLKEYNGPDEYRDLISLPLALNARQNQELLKTIIDVHRNYQGRYYFFSNNCATETLRLLQQTFFAHPRLLAAKIIRPDRLYEGLLQLNLGKGPSLNEIETNSFLRQTLRRQNLFFPSEKHLISNQFDDLKSQRLIPSHWSLEDYFEADPSTRRPFYEDHALNHLTVPLRQRALHRAISLEVAAKERLHLKIQKQLQQSLLNQNPADLNLKEERELRWALSSPQNFQQSDSEHLRKVAKKNQELAERIQNQMPLEKQRRQSEQLLRWLKQKLASIHKP